MWLQVGDPRAAKCDVMDMKRMLWKAWSRGAARILLWRGRGWCSRVPKDSFPRLQGEGNDQATSGRLWKWRRRRRKISKRIMHMSACNLTEETNVSISINYKDAYLLLAAAIVV
jgi:hypothetical protein